MALIQPNSFSRIEKSRNAVHKPVSATFTVFDDSGQKYFQIDTYGTNERIMPEKVSQSLQIDKKMALMLVDILHKEFFID